MTSIYGSPEQNPGFWRSLSANYFLPDLSGPIQLHHAQGDETVPVEFSEILYEQGLDAGMPIELVTYPGDNHNISSNFGVAMSRSVAFFDRWLKQPANLAECDEPQGLHRRRPGQSAQRTGHEFCDRRPDAAGREPAHRRQQRRPHLVAGADGGRAGLGIVERGAGGEGGKGADRRGCGGWRSVSHATHAMAALRGGLV